MSTTIISHNSRTLILQIEIPLEGSMMPMEENIQEALNDAGCVATGKALETFDTDGSPIILGKTKLTARKQKINQTYESPYGKVDVSQYVHKVADARWGDAKSHREEKEAWLENRHHELKHTDGYAETLLLEFETLAKGVRTNYC